MAEKRSLTDPFSDIINSDSSTPSDSTYNLEDHITPPMITPFQLSGSGTDSVDEIESDTSEIIPSYLFQLSDFIIPPFLFRIHTNTRAQNMEYNECLLLDIDVSPSTSCCVHLSQSGFDSVNEIESDISDIIPPYLFDLTSDYIIPPYLFEITAASSSSSESSSKSRKTNKGVTFLLPEVVEIEAESVSTDNECNTNNSSKTNISSTIQSSDEDIQYMPDTLTLTSISTFSLTDTESIVNTDRSDLGLANMFSPRLENEHIEATEDSEQIIPNYLFM